MGYSSEYGCYVKLRNQPEQLQNETAGTPSSLSALYEYRKLIQDGKKWTVPLTFSFSGLTISDNRSVLQSLIFNNVKVDVDKIAQFDQDNNGITINS